MKLASLAALSVAVALAGPAFAQNDPHQSAVNSDARKPNSPMKERGAPDAGTFNPTGPAAAPRPAPAPIPAPPPVVVPAPAPAPVVVPPPPPPPVAAPVPAPMPEPRPARRDRG